MSVKHRRWLKAIDNHKVYALVFDKDEPNYNYRLIESNDQFEKYVKFLIVMVGSLIAHAKYCHIGSSLPCE